MARPGPDVSVISSGHDVADARLHREVAALQRRGLDVEVLACGQPSAAPPNVRVCTWPRGGLARRAWRAATLPWRARGRVLLVLDPDLVPLAWAARTIRRRRLVVDLHEDYLSLLADRHWSRGLVGILADKIVSVAVRLARAADLTVVADDHVPPPTARHRLVLPNLPDPRHVGAPAKPDPLPRAVYVGDLRESRGLFTMIEAVAAAPDWLLDLVGPVATQDQARLDARLSLPDVSGRVRLHGRQEPGRAWQIARGAWVGLSLLGDTPAYREALPSKVYEYLATGIAVIASPLPRQAKLVQEAGAGVAVNNAAEAAGFLQRWAADPTELAAYRRGAQKWAELNLAGRSPYDDFAGLVASLADGHEAI